VGDAATYSAFVPRLKQPCRSGGLAAARTIEQRLSVRSRCGISEKWLGTRSQPPFQYASRVAGEKK
jgi:hypothetical protein